MIVQPREVMDESAHKRKYVAVVGGGGKNKSVVTESVFHRFGHIAPCKVGDYDFLTVLFKLRFQKFGRLFGVSVNGGVGNENAFGFGLVGRPRFVEIEIRRKIGGQHRTVKRTNALYVEGGDLFEDVLHRCAEFADYAEIISPCFAGPVGVVHVKRAEFAERVGGEKSVFGLFVAHYDFRPVNHGRADKRQSVLAQRKLVAVLHDDAAIFKRLAEIALHHQKRFGGRYHDGRRVGFQKTFDAGGMIGLHVVNHEIGGSPAAKNGGNVFEPLFPEMRVDGV